MKNIVLAEKPSVGRELARVLGCSNKGKYFENDQYIVTWALGHLVTLCPPDSYGDKYRRWSLANLPILPDKLNTMVIEKTREQFDLVSSLLNREDADQIIIATDAGREGELVARWILNQAGCDKPIKRLWISSQTDSAIKSGFDNLKDGHDYDNLYAAARSRSYADWYVGYNVSRAMTCHFDTRLSAGRVQTPTLSLVTAREDEIENFTGKFYWTLRADFGSFKASRYSEDNTVRITSEQEALELEKKVAGSRGLVTAIKKVPQAEKPPLAYDLTELQRDANSLLGYTAKETLDILQRLYEIHKIVTYPRTDSRYITQDIVPTIGERLAALSDTVFAPVAAAFQSTGIREDLSRLVDDSMVSDHHALLPTEQKVNVSKLSEKERRLWELVVSRFLETLAPDYEYSTTTLEAVVEGERFMARLTVPASRGWKDVRSLAGIADPVQVAEENADAGILGVKEGAQVVARATELRRGATAPPSRYTEADLLYAMEHAGRFVEDKELRQRLENGLGTPATRADIIEKLIQNNCIERHGLEIVPTAKGRELVRLVPAQLRSAELTGLWEKRLFGIANGTEKEDLFIKDIKKNASELVSQVIADRDAFDPARMGNKDKPCPHCKWPMMKVLDEFDRVHWVCQRFSCGYEEMEVKKKVEVPVVPSAASASPSRRVIASAKPSATGEKKTLVIRKSAVKAVVRETAVKWETVTEVVKESHYRPREQRTPRQDRAAKTAKYENNRSNRHVRESDSGGTFADFIKASEERRKRDAERKRKG